MRGSFADAKGGGLMKIVIGIVASMLTAGMANAAQIVLSPSSVVSTSGAYHPQFAAGNIFDNQIGPVYDEDGYLGYWLNPDNGPANAYITFDLGRVINLTGFVLFNTHNSVSGDRGTGDFSIFGSNAIAGGELVAPTVVISATLAGQPIAGPMIAQSFQASGAYRYLRFNPTSVRSSPDNPNGPYATCCGANVYGLNELRVFGSVPEPQSWALMIAGFGLIGTISRRRNAHAREGRLSA
jgi:hypothetical protein